MVTTADLFRPVLRPLQLWWIDRRLMWSDRTVQVIRAQRVQNMADERAEHMKQVHLAARRAELERG
jgi:hypothetical protein